MEFFFILGFWVGNPVEVGRDSFPSYTGEMGHLHLEGMLFFFNLSYFFSYI